jgi:hypothetical protein
MRDDLADQLADEMAAIIRRGVTDGVHSLIADALDGLSYQPGRSVLRDEHERQIAELRATLAARDARIAELRDLIAMTRLRACEAEDEVARLRQTMTRAERIAVVKGDKRARGRYLGGIVPFGWRLGDAGELVEVPEQQQAIQRMRELRRAGKPLRAIAGEMAAAGHQLSHAGVAKILGTS